MNSMDQYLPDLSPDRVVWLKLRFSILKHFLIYAKKETNPSNALKKTLKILFCDHVLKIPYTKPCILSKKKKKNRNLMLFIFVYFFFFFFYFAN